MEGPCVAGLCCRIPAAQTLCFNYNYTNEREQIDPTNKQFAVAPLCVVNTIHYLVILCIIYSIPHSCSTLRSYGKCQNIYSNFVPLTNWEIIIIFSFELN